MKRLIIIIGLLLMAVPAQAHKPSDSYLILSFEDLQNERASRFSGQWDIALRDLDYALGLDRHQDGQITWGELKAARAEIASYALSRLSLRQGGQTCDMAVADHLVDHHTDGAYAVIQFAGSCPDAGPAVTIDYRLLFDLDPTHRGLLNLTYAGGKGRRTYIFSPERTTAVFEMSDPFQSEGGGSFWAFFREGVVHLLTGFDHILFLLVLLLPSVLRRADSDWTPVANLQPAFWDLLKIVTSFTVAHSITLALAVLDIVRLPSRWVESAIAASIIVAAVNNLRPFVGESRWKVSFGFGLLHGFGFAGVLTGLGLPAGSQFVSLLGFNLGVEVGQMAIVAAFMPLAYVVRSFRFYQRGVLQMGSAGVMVLAFFWMVERILGG